MAQMFSRLQTKAEEWQDDRLQRQKQQIDWITEGLNRCFGNELAKAVTQSADKCLNDHVLHPYESMSKEYLQRRLEQHKEFAACWNECKDIMKRDLGLDS